MHSDRQCAASSPCLRRGAAVELSWAQSAGQRLAEDAQALTALYLVASSVPQHGTEDRDMAYDCSVHRSTGFFPILI